MRKHRADVLHMCAFLTIDLILNSVPTPILLLIQLAGSSVASVSFQKSLAFTLLASRLFKILTSGFFRPLFFKPYSEFHSLLRFSHLYLQCCSCRFSEVRFAKVSCICLISKWIISIPTSFMGGWGWGRGVHRTFASHFTVDILSYIMHLYVSYV